VNIKTKAIGYVRCRAWEAAALTRSCPELQRQRIERLCQREGLTLVDVLERLDRSEFSRTGRA